jgi:hypothetical protein
MVKYVSPSGAMPPHLSTCPPPFSPPPPASTPQAPPPYRPWARPPLCCVPLSHWPPVLRSMAPPAPSSAKASPPWLLDPGIPSPDPQSQTSVAVGRASTPPFCQDFRPLFLMLDDRRLCSPPLRWPPDLDRLPPDSAGASSTDEGESASRPLSGF